MSYLEAYRASIDDPETFWKTAAAAVDWEREPSVVLDPDSHAPATQWFTDGILNTCFNAVDRHVLRGRGAQPALIHDSPVTGTVTIVSYAELRDEVARAAGMLRALGVGPGDRILIYMPMIPEAVVAMLASARLGAIHAVVFAGFAPRELARRIDSARPRVVVAASCGIEPSRIVPLGDLLDDALELAEHQPDHCVMVQRPYARAMLRRDTHNWDSAIAESAPADCVPVPATAPLYILYTSGTTGGPKGVVRDNGGHAVALSWSMRNIYDVSAGDVFWAASDLGWVVGHSYIVYGPLLAGCATVLYEGKPVGTPDAGAFWRVIERHGVRTLFTAPTALRAIRQADPDAALLGDRSLASWRHLFLAGERLDIDTLKWAQARFPVDVSDHWWQTETGWAITGNPLGLEPLQVVPGSAGVPMPGYRLRIVDKAGEAVPPGTDGSVVIQRPLPPGSLVGLWNDSDRFESSYFASVADAYLTGDAGRWTEDGQLILMGRTDDVINVAGHRLSTGALEGVIAEHPVVTECAVVGATDDLKGQIPVAFVVLSRADPATLPALMESIKDRVRGQVGAIAALRTVVPVTRLPKTRSGKTLRRTLRALVDGAGYETPATIEDPAALDEVRASLRETMKRR